MKKFTLFLFAALAELALISCQKEQVIETPENPQEDVWEVVIDGTKAGTSKTLYTYTQPSVGLTAILKKNGSPYGGENGAVTWEWEGKSSGFEVSPKGDEATVNVASAHIEVSKSDNLLTSATVGGELKASVYSQIAVVNNDPDPDVYYLYLGNYVKINENGTFSGSSPYTRQNTYDGECIFRSYDNTSGSVDHTATFWYDKDGVKTRLFPSVSSPVFVAGDVYSQGTLKGWHNSYVIITVTLPNGHQKQYWGIVEEYDQYGGHILYYY